MDDSELDRLRTKVRKVLADSAPGLVDRDPSGPDAEPLLSAVRDAFAQQMDPERAGALAFHLADWAWELEFLVALFSHPDRFTPKEIRGGVEAFLIHAPSHIMAAANLAGWPMGDEDDRG